MSFIGMFGLVLHRGISTTACREGRRNFRKFMLINKRGTKQHKKLMIKKGIHDKRGVRDVGYYKDGVFYQVNEMIPELIVPDLSKTDLKPYVSYRVDDVTQSKFTARDLFNAVYAEKIVKDFKEGKLLDDGMPAEMSPTEKLTAEEARNNARKTGSDMFFGGPEYKIDKS